MQGQAGEAARELSSIGRILSIWGKRILTLVRELFKILNEIISGTAAFPQRQGTPLSQGFGFWRKKRLR